MQSNIIFKIQDYIQGVNTRLAQKQDTAGGFFIKCQMYKRHYDGEYGVLIFQPAWAWYLIRATDCIMGSRFDALLGAIVVIVLLLLTISAWQLWPSIWNCALIVSQKVYYWHNMSFWIFWIVPLVRLKKKKNCCLLSLALYSKHSLPKKWTDDRCARSDWFCLPAPGVASSSL